MTEQDVFQRMHAELKKTDEPRTPWQTADRIWDLFEKYAKELGVDYRSVILSAVEMAYNEFVRPIRLIPNFIDNRILDTLLDSANAWFDNLEENGNDPTVVAH